MLFFPSQEREGDPGEAGDSRPTPPELPEPLLFPLPTFLPNWFGINDELQRMELPDMPIAPPEDALALDAPCTLENQARGDA